MKKSFNILCIAMFAVIILYAAGSIAYTANITYRTVTHISGMSKEDAEKIKNKLELFDNTKYKMCPVTMMPDNFLDLPENTIENTITGEQTATMPISSLVFVKNTDEQAYTHTATGIMGAIGLAAYIFFFCYIIRFIRNVHKNKIFEWANVKILKRMGISVIVAFAVNTIANLIEFSSTAEIFAPKGYHLDWFNIVSDNILLLGIGIVAMIMGEVFACGLKMREEQELTI